MTEFRHLLAPGRIGTLALRNRILMTPMGEDLGDEGGRVSERQLAYVEARARGGAALVSLGSVGVAWPAGTANRFQTGLSDDAMIPGVRALAERAHRHGAALALQLSHMGAVANNDVAAARPLLVPSPPPRARFDPLYRMMTAEEQAGMMAPYTAKGARLAHRVATPDDLAGVVEAFAAAAARAREAGVDGVELHGAHGYLIDEFLSPRTNQRDDAYGGSLENRARLLLEVIRAVRERVGSDYPVWVRLNGEERLAERGTTVDDACRVARWTAEAGADAIHVSAYADPGRAVGITESHTPHAPGALLGLARRVKAAVSVPVIAVGRIDPAEGDRWIGEGAIDFVAMGRKLLADPELPAKLAAGRPGSIRPCIYHYRCVGQIFVRERVACVANPSVGREAELAVAPAAAPRSVLVVGAGAAGLEAARVAARRGHRVVLADAGERLGGRLALAARCAEPTAELLAWLVGEVESLGVEVRLGATLDAGAVRRLAPDAVLVATGARWDARPDVPGADLPHVLDLDAAAAWLLGDGRLPGARVVVLGGGKAGLGAAGVARARGHAVSVLERGPVLAVQLGLPGRWQLVDQLGREGVALHTGATPVAIDAAALTWREGDAEHRTPADVVLCAEPAAPARTLADDLAAAGVPARVIGDAVGPPGIEGALLAATRAALAL